MQNKVKIFDPSAIVSAFPYILAKLPITLELTVISATFGLIMGFFLALIKINKTPVVSQICAVFVSFMRGTPLLVQLFLVYYGLPLVMKEINLTLGTSINVNIIPAVVFAYVAFSLNEAAYFSETIRSAILSVDLKEIEAAKSVGMTGVQVMLRITLPEAVKVAIPNLGNCIISLLKGTSLAFTITVMDIMGAANAVAGSNLRYFEVYIAASLIYWACCLIIEQAVKLIEKKTDVMQRETSSHAES